jgi:hypothetical protein
MEYMLMSALVLALIVVVYHLGSTIIALRRSQLRIEQIRFINDPAVDEALTEILWVWDWTDFDDYWKKFSPRVNPEANKTRRIARNYYVALAEMVRKGDLEIEFLYKLNPSGVTRYWEKIGPIAHEFRKRNNYPDYLEPVEYLATRIDEFRKNLGITGPNQVK